MRYLIFFIISIAIAPLHAQETLKELLKQHNEQTVPYISVDELCEIQGQPGLLLLDTREKEEYKVSKIKGAVYVGYNKFSEEKITKLPDNKNQLIIVYCSLGIRSENIGERLQKAGFTNVKNLYGGIFEWKNNGLSVVNDQGKETDKVHAYSRKWGKWLHKGEKIY